MLKRSIFCLIIFFGTCRFIFGEFSAINWSVYGKSKDVISREAYSNPDTDVLSVESEGTQVKIHWKQRDNVSAYILLKSDVLGWQGSLPLLKEINPKDTIINVGSTAGLHSGDEIHIKESREDFYIKQVINETQIELVSPVGKTFSAGSSLINLSAAWVKNYSVYSSVSIITESGQPAYSYTDAEILPGKDYFYVLAYISNNMVTGFSNPINFKLTGNILYYDAALGCNGGYAWKAGQKYSDTPELINGNPESSAIRIQYSNPSIKDVKDFWLGFHRINLNNYLLIKEIEISQDMSADRIQAVLIRIGYDDRTYDLINLLNSSRTTTRDETIGGRIFRHYFIKCNKKTSYVNIFIDDVSGKKGKYTEWNKIGIYTDQAVKHPAVYAGAVESVNLEIDFSKPDGKLPVIFGTDEIYDSSNGMEQGFMLQSWPGVKKLFNLYRIHMNDFPPRAFGTDLIKIGELSEPVSDSDKTLVLKTKPAKTFFLNRNDNLKIGYELVGFNSVKDKSIYLSERGKENTLKAAHDAGSFVYAYKNVQQILRLQEILPEFKVVKFSNAYISGLVPVKQSVDINAPERTGTIEIVVWKNDLNKNDVIRIGREMFIISKVKNNSPEPGQLTLTVKRGFDGTNQQLVQYSEPAPDVYKIKNYESWYTGFKNDPVNYNNYFWDNFKTSMDKVILEGDAVPWLVAFSPRYATSHRGKVKQLITLDNPSNSKNFCVIDEYNSVHDDSDFWYLIAPENKKDDDINIKGNMYQYYHSELHMLTGKAAGKVFYIRSSVEDRFTVVKTYEDSLWEDLNPGYVNLYDEGVRPGDIYKITHGSNRISPNASPRYWQYNADFFYNITKFIRTTYKDKLADTPFYIEYYNEPNLAANGTWTRDSYIQSYNIFADTIRNGGPHFKKGFSKEEVVIGAGAISGGLNTENKIAGAAGDYNFALSLIEKTPVMDFLSHHRTYSGSRTGKRENSWEYAMLRNYAQTFGKEIQIIDSENSSFQSGSTSQEKIKHRAQIGVPYWTSNFINSYYGDYGDPGRLSFIIHTRLYSSDDGSSGLVIDDKSGNPIFDIVYWPIKLYRDYTSHDRLKPDTLARVIKGWDNYGWIQAAGTTNGETGVRYVHIVNKKNTPVKINLNLSGIRGLTQVEMKSINGGGINQSISDGYHPLTLSDVVRSQRINDLRAIVIEPFSSNIIIIP